MCRIDSQLKKLIRLKYLIYQTPYTFFSIFIWYFSFTHTSPMFSGIASNNFSFFGFSNRSFFVFVFTTFFKKILFLNIFSIYLILFQVKALLCHRKCSGKRGELCMESFAFYGGRGGGGGGLITL